LSECRTCPPTHGYVECKEQTIDKPEEIPLGIIVEKIMVEISPGVWKVYYKWTRGTGTQAGGYYWWRVVFNLEDGTYHPHLQSYCKSRDMTQCQFGGIVY